jgi:hypothetical protein
MGGRSRDQDRRVVGAALVLRIAVVLLLIANMGVTVLALAAAGTTSEPELLASVLGYYIGADAACLTLLGFLQIGGRLHPRHWLWIVAAVVSVVPWLAIILSYVRQ